MAHPAPSRTPSAGRKHLVLLGAGAGNLHLLVRLATRPVAGLQVTMVCAMSRPFRPALLPRFIAGQRALQDCCVVLEPLLQRAGVQRLTRRVAVLQAASHTVALDDGQVLHYDWLSVDTGAEQDRQRLEGELPGVREHGLFLCPADAFAALWPRVTELASGRLRSVAVVGDGAPGLEAALAIRQRLPQAAVTLVTGGASAGADFPSGMASLIRMALRQRRVTVLPDRAVALRAGEVVLQCGARLACDVPVIAISRKAPAWLADSGLGVDASGQPMADPCQRSTSHGNVFLAPDLSFRPGTQGTYDDLHAVLAAPRLADNILRAAGGGAIPPVALRPPSVRLLDCGDGAMIAAWGRFALQGRWVGRWAAHSLAATVRPFTRAST